MSHHFDWPIPGIPGSISQDVSDVHCFAGPSDNDGPRTVIGMNASPQFFQPTDLPWDPGALYELKLDLNDDFVEDITWRFTFSQPDPSTGEPKYVQVAQLTGADATSRTAPGTIITPPNAPVGEALSVGDGIKIFAGERLDSFFTDISVPKRMRDVLPPDAAVKFHADPDLHGLAPFHNTFAGQLVRLVMVELPAGITGLDPIQCWGSTAIFDEGHGVWHQIQRAAGPDVSVVFDNGGAPYLETINSTEPTADLAGRPANPATDPATGVWGTVRDQVAAVVDAMGTYGKGKNGQPTPMAYGAFVADTFLPNVLRFTPGTTALWDPYNGVRNGKGLFEELASNFARMVTNTNFTTHLTQQTPLLDYFPYLAPPPGS
jgi:hypothetical protein